MNATDRLRIYGPVRPLNSNSRLSSLRAGLFGVFLALVGAVLVMGVFG